MHSHPFHYSVSFFEQLYHDLPPLFPKADREAMQNAREHMQHNHSLTAEEIEHTTVVFGMKIWPYRRAFEEFYEKVEQRRADEFFEAHARPHPAFAAWWKEWRGQGHHAAALFRGAAATWSSLSSEERVALCDVCVSVKQDLKHAATALVSGQERAAYEKRVVEFTVLQEAIQERLGRLRELADDAQEHPRLATEIRQAVRDFEKGLAFMQPHTTFEEVCHLEARVPVRRKVILESAKGGR